MPEEKKPKKKRKEKVYDTYTVEESYSVTLTDSEGYSFVVMKPIVFEIHHLPYSKGLIYGINKELGVSTHDMPVCGITDLSYEILRRLTEVWLQAKGNRVMKEYFKKLNSYYTCVYRGDPMV